MNPVDLSAQLVVIPVSSEDRLLAQHCAEKLGCGCLEVDVDPVTIRDWPLSLLCSNQGIELQQTGPKPPGPVKVDFLTGAVAHRRRFGGGGGQQIAKAIGIRPGVRPTVIDATAGLGRDSFVLASLGCDVTMIERSPIIALLLADGLQRARQDLEVSDILARMSLLEADGIDWMDHLATAVAKGEQQAPQVVYLDPMFPHRNNSAEIKKEMRVFRELVGDDQDAAALLEQALAVANNRVVVKRPRKADPISGPKPSHQLVGKSGRFDVYALKRL